MRNSWITKTFDELGDILIGGTPARNNALFWSEENTGNAWVSIADLSKAGKKITNTKESITDLGVRASNVKKISKGSIIFSFKLSVGKKAITDRELYTNEAIAAFIFNEKSNRISFANSIKRNTCHVPDRIDRKADGVGVNMGSGTMCLSDNSSITI